MLNYMTLNPIVLRAVASTLGIAYSDLAKAAAHGALVQLPEQMVESAILRIGSSLPRQPHCPPPPSDLPYTLQYAAAVIDCEGFVGPVWYRRSDRAHDGVRLAVSIAQNHRPMLELIQALIGDNGKIYNLRRTVSQNRPCYTLRYDGVHAICALCRVYPFLYRKREQAQVMLRAFIDGRLWEHVGARGVAPHVRALRRRYVRKLQKMH
jgi:hypothetical protein